jgi:hypothetical protein
LSKTKKITHDTPLQDEFPLTKEEDELMERVKAGKEPSKTFDNIEDLLDDLHS